MAKRAPYYEGGHRVRNIRGGERNTARKGQKHGFVSFDRRLEKEDDNSDRYERNETRRTLAYSDDVETTVKELADVSIEKFSRWSDWVVAKQLQAMGCGSITKRFEDGSFRFLMYRQPSDQEIKAIRESFYNKDEDKKKPEPKKKEVSDSVNEKNAVTAGQAHFLNSIGELMGEADGVNEPTAWEAVYQREVGPTIEEQLQALIENGLNGVTEVIRGTDPVLLAALHRRDIVDALSDESGYCLYETLQMPDGAELSDIREEIEQDLVVVRDDIRDLQMAA